VALVREEGAGAKTLHWMEGRWITYVIGHGGWEAAGGKDVNAAYTMSGRLVTHNGDAPANQPWVGTMSHQAYSMKRGRAGDSQLWKNTSILDSYLAERRSKLLRVPNC